MSRRPSITPFPHPESLSTSPRSTSSTSTVFPYLKRLDTTAQITALAKPPLLVLKLTEPTFLHTDVIDSSDKTVLYSLRTHGVNTLLKRPSVKHGEVLAAEVRWVSPQPVASKARDDAAVVQMHGAKWKRADSFLKSGGISSSSKFSIPGFPKQFKWKRVDNTFYCTTSSVKGPIAMFEPCVASLPGELRVYETFHDVNDVDPHSAYSGVSLTLLDYLIITAMILGTPPDAWSKPFSHSSPRVAPTPKRMPSELPLTPSVINDMQWRKLMLGEPMYKRASSSALSIDSLVDADSLEMDTTNSDFETTSSSANLSLYSNAPSSGSYTNPRPAPPVPGLPSAHRTPDRQTSYSHPPRARSTPPIDDITPLPMMVPSSSTPVTPVRPGPSPLSRRRARSVATGNARRPSGDSVVSDSSPAVSPRRRQLPPTPPVPNFPSSNFMSSSSPPFSGSSSNYSTSQSPYQPLLPPFSMSPTSNAERRKSMARPLPPPTSPSPAGPSSFIPPSLPSYPHPNQLSPRIQYHQPSSPHSGSPSSPSPSPLSGYPNHQTHHPHPQDLLLHPPVNKRGSNSTQASDLAHYVQALGLSHPGDHSSGGVDMDAPPPAYNQIDFRRASRATTSTAATVRPNDLDPFY